MRRFQIKVLYTYCLGHIASTSQNAHLLTWLQAASLSHFFMAWRTSGGTSLWTVMGGGDMALKDVSLWCEHYYTPHSFVDSVCIGMARTYIYWQYSHSLKQLTSAADSWGHAHTGCCTLQSNGAKRVLYTVWGGCSSIKVHRVPVILSEHVHMQFCAVQQAGWWVWLLTWTSAM